MNQGSERMVLREVTYLAVIVRITAAFLLGGILGLERGLKQRPAGLRTYMLVCVGACMVMLTNQFVFQVYQVGDPVRMGAQVISGIGFLGAGTIMVTKRHRIKGLTTAAGLWAAAAVGLALGIGFYEAAVMGSIMILLTLTVVHGIDSRIHDNTRLAQLYVEVDNTLSIGRFSKSVRELGLEIEELQLDREYSADCGVRSLVLTVRAKQKLTHKDLREHLQEIDGVVYVDEI